MQVDAGPENGLLLKTAGKVGPPNRIVEYIEDGMTDDSRDKRACAIGNSQAIRLQKDMQQNGVGSYDWCASIKTNEVIAMAVSGPYFPSSGACM